MQLTIDEYLKNGSKRCLFCDRYLASSSNAVSLKSLCDETKQQLRRRLINPSNPSALWVELHPSFPPVSKSGVFLRSLSNYEEEGLKKVRIQKRFKKLWKVRIHILAWTLSTPFLTCCANELNHNFKVIENCWSLLCMKNEIYIYKNIYLNEWSKFIESRYFLNIQECFLSLLSQSEASRRTITEKLPKNVNSITRIFLGYLNE